MSAIVTPAAHVNQSASVPTKVKKRNPIRKFSHKEIDEKVQARATTVPNYRELLMACAVKEDDVGVDIDTSHPGWIELLRTVTAADSRAKSQTSETNKVNTILSENSTNSNVRQQVSQQDKTKKPEQDSSSAQSSNKTHRFPSHEQWIESRPIPADIYKKIESELFLEPPSPLNPRGVPDPNTRLSTIVKLCSQHGIPASLRPHIWAALLGAHITLAQHQQPTASQLLGYTDSEDVDSIEKALAAQQSSADDGSSEGGFNSTVDPQRVSLDLENQRVIKVDIHRTLPQVPYFSSAGVQHLMEQVLTSYCKDSAVSYKQGLNYILAPFLLIRLPIFRDAKDSITSPRLASVEDQVDESKIDDKAGFISSGDSAMDALSVMFSSSEEDVVSALQNDSKSILACLKAIVSRALPNTYSDNEFGALQCLLSLFRLLLQYHDPALGTFLDANDMGPELYAASWFLTLHVNRIRGLHVIIHLWDSLLLELRADPLFHYMVSLALLLHHRDEIMSEGSASLPEKLSKLAFTSVEQVDAVVAKAKILRASTPVSFSLQLHAFTSANYYVDSDEYERLSSSPSLSLSVDELLSHCFSDESPFAVAAASQGHKVPQSPVMSPSALPEASSYPSIVYVALDCRSRAQFTAGHLPGAIHMPPSLIQNPQALTRYTNTLRAMQDAFEEASSPRNIHFTFMGPSSSAASLATITPLLLHFVSENIQNVSVVQGGYRAVHALISPTPKPSKNHGIHPLQSETVSDIEFSNQHFRRSTGSLSSMHAAHPTSTSSATGPGTSHKHERDQNLYMSSLALAPSRPSSATIHLIDHDPLHCFECLHIDEETPPQGQTQRINGAINKAFGRFASMAQKVRTTANSAIWAASSSISPLSGPPQMETTSINDFLSPASQTLIEMESSTYPSQTVASENSKSARTSTNSNSKIVINSRVNADSNSVLDADVLPSTLHLVLPQPGSASEASLDCALGSNMVVLLLSTSLRDLTVKGHEFRKTVQSILPHIISKCIAAGVQSTSLASPKSSTSPQAQGNPYIAPVIPLSMAHKPNSLSTFAKVLTNSSLDGGFSHMKGTALSSKITFISVAEKMTIQTRNILQNSVTAVSILDHAMKRGVKRVGPIFQYGFGQIELEIPTSIEKETASHDNRVYVRDRSSMSYQIANVSLPGDVYNTFVVLFVPAVTAEEADIGPVIDFLLSKGIDIRSICILTFSITQQSAWGLAMRYPELPIVALSMDIVAPLNAAIATGNTRDDGANELQEVSRIVPGVHAILERYSDDFTDETVRRN